MNDRIKDALSLIETITAHNEELPENLNTEKERELHNAITLIFRIAHVAREPNCMSAHESWEDEFQELRKELLPQTS